MEAAGVGRLADAAPSFGVGKPVNWPRKEPMAVRLAPTMTTLISDMGNSVGTEKAQTPDG